MIRHRQSIFHALIISLAVLTSGSASSRPLPAPDGQPLPSLSPIIKRISPSIVNISTVGYEELPNHPLTRDPFFRFFFELPNQPRQRQTQSLGSGVIIDAERGYILTNDHITSGAHEIKVVLADEREFRAQLIGADADTDVAVIQIEADNLVAAPLADSDQIEVGDFVVAIGHPFGLSHSVSLGIISGLGRSGLGRGIENFIQTDATINPGNSGGGLIDMRGQLVGINTRIFSKSGGSIGIGFAIPINLATNVMQQLIDHGQVRRGRLGVVPQDLTDKLARAFGLDRDRGAVITHVYPDSAAEAAGIKQGDIVVGANGRNVDDARSLWNAIGLLNVGDSLTLDIIRHGQPLTLTAQLQPPEPDRIAGKELHPALRGAELGKIEQQGRYRAPGVAVLNVERDSPAWQAALRRGDVIAEINRQPVTGLSSLREILREAGPGELLLLVQRGGQAYYVTIR